MIFETYNPNGIIGEYLESLIYFKDFIPDHSIERVIPTGHVFLIFELDNIVRSTYDNDTLKPNKTYRKVWVSGMHKNYISISAHQKSEMFVIQFKAYGAYPFFHNSIDKINEQIFHAEELFGNEILELRKSLLKADNPQEKFKLVEGWLNKRFDNEKQPKKAIINVINEFQKPSKGIFFNKLIEHYPFTQKHLIAQFKKYVGLTPKYFHRIMRFNEILAKIQQKENISWSQISYDYGFSDQPHFIKDFKHFSGFNPTEFIQAGYEDDERNFFPLDREG